MQLYSMGLFKIGFSHSASRLLRVNRCLCFTGECGMDVSQATPSPREGHLGCFQLGVVSNTLTMNIHVQVLAQVHVFISLRISVQEYNC